jgi:hypothetical protein
MPDTGTTLNHAHRLETASLRAIQPLNGFRVDRASGQVHLFPCLLRRCVCGFQANERSRPRVQGRRAGWAEQGLKQESAKWK